MLGFHLSVAARTLWQEARGEPLDGQKAVAHVIANRVTDGRWGRTLAEVCLSEFHGVYQFSGWARSDPNRIAAMRLPETDTLLNSLATLIYNATNGESDPTGGATHYYAARIPAPAWVAGDPARDIPPATPCGKFGSQLFFKNVK